MVQGGTMASMNWEKVEHGRKKALIRAAADELPQTIKARYAGLCTECKSQYPAGTGIQRSMTGWKHAHCALIPSIHDRMTQRRETLRQQRSAAR